MSNDNVTPKQEPPDPDAVFNVQVYVNGKGHQIDAMVPYFGVRQPTRFFGHATFGHARVPQPVPVTFPITAETVADAFTRFEAAAKAAYIEFVAQVDKPRIVRPGM